MAYIIGYAGVLPLALLAIDYLVGGPIFPGFALQAFLVYAAAVLAFKGGVRWGGAAASDRWQRRHLLLSGLPPLWAAGALLLPGPVESLWALAGGFLILGALDVWLSPAALPEWMPRLRLQLNAFALGCHGLMFYAVSA